MKDNSLWIGNCAMLIYTFITAISSIVIHDTNQTIPPLISAFYTFIFCILGYSIFSLRLIYKIDLVKSNLLTILILNITTAIGWIFTFVSLKYIPVTLFLFAYLCAMPIASSLIYRVNLLRALFLMIGIICLYLTYNDNNLLPGFILAMLGGTCGTVYSIYSKKVTLYFSTLEILSLRFYLTVLITFILTIYVNNFGYVENVNYSQFVIIALLSVFIPLFCFQVGIKHLSINHAMSYLPFAPLICYSLNLVTGDQKINLIQVLVISFLFLLMLLNFKKRRVDASIHNRGER